MPHLLARGSSRDNLRDAAPVDSSSDVAHRRTVSSEATPRPSAALASAVRQAAAAASIPASLLPPMSHSRGDSSATRDGTGASGAKASPSKALSAARTYDPKVISREMHRLGAGITTALLTSAGAAASNLSLPQSIAGSTPPVPALHEAWHNVHLHLLPLFNREPLRRPIEDLNVYTRKHISVVVSDAPHKAISTLEADVSELLTLGMLTLEARLKGPDDGLPGRVVEVWRFFWDSILSYMEGALLPLQTDTMLASLQRKNKLDRERAGSRSDSTSHSAALSGYLIDVRTIALRLFRDKLLLPISKPLAAAMIQSKPPLQPYEQKRMQQMLLILASYTRSPPPLLSLTEPIPPPSAGDQALASLLRAARSPQLDQLSSSRQAVRAPSFLSSKVPRDRRARIAGRPGKNVDFAGPATGSSLTSGSALDGVEEVDEIDAVRQIDAEFLDSLRSPTTATPEVEITPRPGGAIGSGGWGLGEGNEGTPQPDEEEGDDYSWDSATAAVEKMAGMKER